MLYCALVLSLNQPSKMIYLNVNLLILFISMIGTAQGQSCTKTLPLPAGASQNTDVSGLRPSRQPPIAIGQTLNYQCPGVKAANGISSWIVSCNELENYVFPTSLNEWPMCECNEDLTMKCVGITYKINYIDQPGDVGTMTLLLPQPPYLLTWTMTLITDLNIQSLNPWTSDAQLTMTGQTGFTLQPGANADLNAAFASIDIVYNFSVPTSTGSVPHWQFPCVASIDCSYEVQNATTSNEIWMIIGLVAAGFVVCVILCSICVCCCCQGGSKPARSGSRASSQVSDWNQVEESHFRQVNMRQGRTAFSAPATRRY